MLSRLKSPEITEDGSGGDLAALEALIIDNHDLAELDQLLAGFNLFEALGNTRREERHSDFLAFLMDPSQPHGLDETFLRAFVQVALEDEPKKPSKLKRIDAALFDLSEARVEREWNRIDILVRSDAEGFILLIENKVDTDEHSDQLRRYVDLIYSRYPGWRVLPVFLTRDGHAGSHPAYHSVSYADVHGILEGLLEHQRSSLPSDVEVVVRHYVEMLERHIMEDTRIAELARKIYARHARALDIIFEHRPDALDLIRQEIQNLIEDHQGLRLVYSSKSLIHFVPTAWDEIPRLHEGGDGTWFKSPALVRFEFKVHGGLSLHLQLGPGEQTTRTLVYDESKAKKHKSVFGTCSKTLSGKFCRIWQMPFFSKKEDADLSVDEKITRLHDRWVAFVGGDLPKLTEVLIQALE